MVSSADYIYRRTDSQDILPCDCCGAEVPTRSYPHAKQQLDWLFCQICDSMSVSVNVQHNTLYARDQLEKPASVPEIAKLLNLAIDVITGRKEHG